MSREIRRKCSTVIRSYSEIGIAQQAFDALRDTTGYPPGVKGIRERGALGLGQKVAIAQGRDADQTGWVDRGPAAPLGKLFTA